MKFETELLRLDLQDRDALFSDVAERLETLDEIATRIGEVPILAPLSSDSAVGSIAVNELLHDYLDPLSPSGVVMAISYSNWHCSRTWTMTQPCAPMTPGSNERLTSF